MGLAVSAARDLMAELRRLGIHLTLDRDALRFRPADALTPELRTRLLAVRDEVITEFHRERDIERARLFTSDISPDADIVGPFPCRVCNGTRWWRLRDAQYLVCATCHPPAVPLDRVVWVEDGGDDAS